MSWSKGLGFMHILQRPELTGDPETKSILELTKLAGGLQDLWLSISRRNPLVLERTLTTRPDDGRTVGEHIMARMDAMGRTCDAYLDRTLPAGEFREQVKEHRKVTRALAAEIKVTDLGQEKP